MLKNIKYYIWHNPVMDKLESLTSKLNVWFWQKRFWGRERIKIWSSVWDWEREWAEGL